MGRDAIACEDGELFVVLDSKKNCVYHVLGRRISINKLVIRLFVFEAFLRASEFFPAREGTRKSVSVADGLMCCLVTGLHVYRIPTTGRYTLQGRGAKHPLRPRPYILLIYELQDT